MRLIKSLWKVIEFIPATIHDYKNNDIPFFKFCWNNLCGVWDVYYNNFYKEEHER